MSNYRSLTEVKPLEDVKAIAAKLKEKGSAGSEAGLMLAQEAAKFGLNLKDYITFAGASQSDAGNNGLNAYEKLLCELNIPIRNDFERGVSLQAAADTFQTHAGTRALFPQVIDDVVRFATRQDQFEKVAPMVANSRTISGAELLSTVIDDDSKDRDTFLVPEGSNIPVRTIRTSEKTVKMYKHGSAIRTTYEFNRRASIDLLVPYANRVGRELELSKVKAATSILVNGDGAYSAAGEIDQSSYNTPVGTNSTNGVISSLHLLKWLVTRAQAGTPIDSVVMNWDGWFQWLKMFTVQGSNAGNVAAENLRNAGVDLATNPNLINLTLAIKPILSSTCPDNKLIGFSQGDTLEELVEANSQIQESERAIKNQTVTIVRTENTGYRLVYGDTRSVFDFGA